MITKDFNNLFSNWKTTPDSWTTSTFHLEEGIIAMPALNLIHTDKYVFLNLQKNMIGICCCGCLPQKRKKEDGMRGEGISWKLCIPQFFGTYPLFLRMAKCELVLSMCQIPKQKRNYILLWSAEVQTEQAYL